MRLSRLQIQAFRNFERVDCALARHVVLLGENGAGKSNLLYALRLVLDPDLPDSERYLRAEDFWSGGAAFAGAEVVVSVDITDYSGDAAVLACLGDHEIETPQGATEPVARLTYRYAPKGIIEENQRATTTAEDYEFAIYGRDDPSNDIRRDVRRFLVFKLLPALRDAEADLQAWRRSPLRPLLEDVAPTLDAAALRTAASGVDRATDAVTGQAGLVALRDNIAARINAMIGRQHHMSPTLGFASTDPSVLLRSLRLFVDAERRWDVSGTSLGLANVLYLALLLLHANQQLVAHKLAALLLGIEEPEAHLHPQLQRQVFRDLLRGERPVVVSTHSPNIASVAPIDSLVVLRATPGTSTLRSFADATGFTDQQRADLAHYLDVTRAEILFGRGIILVEGDAEEFIVPAAARLMAPATELDEFGVSVCSVAGTDFVPYARFLSHFGIPYVVVTDGDRTAATGAGTSPGIERGLEILGAAGTAVDDIRAATAAGDRAEATRLLGARGVFVGDRTLEADLVSAGAGPRFETAYCDLRPGTRNATLAPFRAPAPLDDAAEAAIVELIKRPGVGKGRFAQRLAASLTAADLPLHLTGAISSIAERCRHV